MTDPESAVGNGPFLQTLQGAEQAFLARRRKKQADVESAVAIFLEFLRGFELFDVPDPCVTVFGSARIFEGHPHYQMARDLGRSLAEAGYSVITGGGPGLMEAANRGAKDGGATAWGAASPCLPSKSGTPGWIPMFILNISSCAR